MKSCVMCNTKCEDDVLQCPSCQSEDFSYICYNCGEIFDSGFCPSCGVEAGNKGKMCPNCNKLYFARSCTECGYYEMAASANKTYKVSEEALAKAKEGLKNDGVESEEKVGINGKNLSPEALMLADMAMNRVPGMPLNFSAFAPTVSEKSKTTAIILCVLFGWLGFHQFYVGNNKKGLLYFATMGLFFVGAIIDLFALFGGEFKDSKGLPVTK